MVENAVNLIPRRWLVPCMGAALFALQPGFASEKIEIEGGAVQLPKSGSRLEERSPSFDVTADKPEMGGFLPPPTPAAGVMDRKLKEAIDRKKNWIFVNPYEVDRQTSGLDKLEKEEKDNPLEFKGDQETQSVFERFVKEKDRRLQEKKELGRDDPRGENKPEPFNPFARRDMDMDLDMQDADDAEFARELSLQTFLNPGQGFGRSEERDPYQKNHFNFTTLADRPALSPSQQEDLRKQEEQRSATFEKLLQPRNLTPSIAGVVDPIGSQPDSSREAANPIVPSYNDRSASSGFNSSFGGDSGSAFSSEGPARASADLVRPSSFDASNIRAPQAPASLPSFSSPSPSAPNAAFGASSPFTLDIPKRKF